MQDRKSKFSALAISLFALVGLAIPAVALAAPNVHANAQSATSQTSDQTSAESDSATDTGQSSRHNSKAQTRLADAKLKACQNRQQAITNIMMRIADRGQKQLNLFSSIADKTEKFYAEKGKTLTNYDALVADVNAKQAAAQSEVTMVKTSSTSFDCASSDPKGFVNTFKGNLKAEIQALKDFKTSVKNLIVGVKSVQGATSSTGNKATGSNQ